MTYERVENGIFLFELVDDFIFTQSSNFDDMHKTDLKTYNPKKYFSKNVGKPAGQLPL